MLFFESTHFLLNFYFRKVTLYSYCKHKNSISSQTEKVTCKNKFIGNKAMLLNIAEFNEAHCLCYTKISKNSQLWSDNELKRSTWGLKEDWRGSYCFSMGPSELISKITNRSPFNLGNDGAAERRGREMRPLAQLHHYSFSVPPPGGMFSSSIAQLSLYNKGCGVTILFPTRQKEKHIVFTMFQFCRVDKTSRNTIESSKF